MILYFKEPEGAFTSSDAWTITDTSNCSCEILGQCLHFIIGSSATGESPTVEPPLVVSGDFDIRLYYVGLDVVPSFLHGLTLNIGSVVDPTDKLYVRAGYDSGDKYILKVYEDGSTTVNTSTARTWTFGGLRVVRSGSSVTVHTKDGNAAWSSWTTQTFNSDNVDLSVSFFSGDSTSSSPRGGTVSSVEIAAGTITGHSVVSGEVSEAATDVERTVRVYNRTTGELVGETTSSAVDGTFSVDLLGDGDVSLVALDDAAGDDYNALIYDNVTPG